MNGATAAFAKDAMADFVISGSLSLCSVRTGRLMLIHEPPCQKRLRLSVDD